MAAENKNDYGTKSPLEKKRRINIVKNEKMLSEPLFKNQM
jgi:hypothetical protein